MVSRLSRTRAGLGADAREAAPPGQDRSSADPGGVRRRVPRTARGLARHSGKAGLAAARLKRPTRGASTPAVAAQVSATASAASLKLKTRRPSRSGSRLRNTRGKESFGAPIESAAGDSAPPRTPCGSALVASEAVPCDRDRRQPGEECDEDRRGNRRAVVPDEVWAERGIDHHREPHHRDPERSPHLRDPEELGPLRPLLTARRRFVRDACHVTPPCFRASHRRRASASGGSPFWLPVITDSTPSW